jgi:signal transduction histidine kinase
MLIDFQPATLWPRFSRFRDSLDNRALKDSLLNLNAASYKDKYETRVLTFSSSEEPLYNSDPATFNELNTILNTQARKTGKPGLFYFDESFEKFSYISRIDIQSPDSLLGYVFVIASPKRFRSEALYPELFSRGQTTALENSQLYSIGLYKDGRLFGSYNEFPFPTHLNESRISPEDFYFEEDAERKFSILWHYAGSGRLVAIARENRQFLESITLFSYLFCAFLLLMAFLWVVSGMVRAGMDRRRIKELWQFNIRNQIHGTIILISVISFLFIGLATFLFFRSRYDKNNRINLARTAGIMERELKSYITSGKVQAKPGGMEMVIKEISEVHGADINMYGLDGKVLYTSFPLPYTTGIISSFMEPEAYYHVKFLKEIQYFQKERIGRLRYSSLYLPVMDAEGRTYSFLQIPYFTAQYNLNQEISYFLITIINLNAFIFLIAGIVALFITNRITGSFSMIADKMKKVSLGGQNEPIVWKRNDEIGALVKEYNRMVAQLDDSARALAKSEGAWKEMARQVAHEIKNPLTPMKLSLQYLQRSLLNKEPNVEQLTAEVSRTLIEQIDHLNNIANEFNQFAHIEQSGKEEFDLNEVLHNVLSLFRSDPKLKLDTQWLSGPLIIRADKTHINRVFTNLLKNAIQAVPPSRNPEIGLRGSREAGKIIIAISDNGEGIDEEVKPLIFTPNFTTKTSGSGLGLAICKRIAEQSGGNIRFESQKGKGTVFYVELPLIS